VYDTPVPKSPDTVDTAERSANRQWHSLTFSKAHGSNFHKESSENHRTEENCICCGHPNRTNKLSNPD